MNAHDLIMEVLDKPAPFRWLKRGETQWVAEFSVEGVQYTFSAQDMTVKRHLMSFTWEVEFWQEDGTEHGKMDVTGSGGEFVVFATIKAIFEEWISIEQPDKVKFTATDTVSRQRLYRRFAAKIAQKFGYSVLVHIVPGTTFTLIKKEV